uniref:FBD domain-containing protein n=1 Tax=Tanacetum cinerariifolium TaxID=118510 RepID=A0A6L2NMJ6_TANCI|nr:hypothetical protein [Tanacetum cinerariifolium]
MDLDTLIYRRDEVSPAMILKKVIDYAFSHKVKHLDLWVDGVEGREWPVVLTGFVNSLISLRLQSCSKIDDEKRMFDDLMMFFSKVYSVKSLKVCKAIVHILSLFQEELVSRCPHFRDFKFDVEDLDRRTSKSTMRKTEFLELGYLGYERVLAP